MGEVIDVTTGYVEQFEAIAEFLRTAQYSTPATAAFVEAYEISQKG